MNINNQIYIKLYVREREEIYESKVGFFSH